MNNKKSSVSSDLLAMRQANKSTKEGKQPTSENTMSAPQPKEQPLEVHEHFALGKQNYLLIALSFLLVIIGFILMMGSGTTETTYNPDIFSTRRIVIAPLLAFLGFVCILFAILRKPSR